MSYPVKKQLNDEINPVLRKHFVGVRFNDAEFSLVSDLAEKANVTIAEFCREQALKYNSNDTNEVQFSVLCGVVEQTYDKVVEVLDLVKK